MPGRFKGCTRGIFGLKSWDPLPSTDDNLVNVLDEVKEKMKAASIQDTSGRGDEPRPVQPAGRMADNRPVASVKPVPAAGGAAAAGGKRDPRVGRKMKAKYNYKANPESPIGRELTARQLEEFEFVEECVENPEWWLVLNAAGDRGYVPKSYMQLEEATMGLPWLQNRQLMEEKREPEGAAGNVFGAPQQGSPGDATSSSSLAAQPVAYKPYRSAYDKAGEAKAEPTKYRCDICDKNLNGPQPYNAHMASKAHKEMVEYMQG